MTPSTLPKPDPNEILRAEYDYIAQSAFQANEDRARVTSFYILAVSSLVAAILGAKLFEGENQIVVNLGFGGLFLLLTVLGFLTIFQLARLRAAWYSAVEALNEIKKYYIDYFKEIKLGDAFAWKDLKAVPKYKRGSVSYFLALEISLLSAITFGASIYFFQSALAVYEPKQAFLLLILSSMKISLSILMGIAVGVAQMLYYRYYLKQ